MTLLAQFKNAGADISGCQQFCYRLWREWDDTLPTLGFILLCAEMAAPEQTTAQLGRCLMHAVDRDYGAIEVAHLFSRRVVDSSLLGLETDRVGDPVKAQAALLEVLDRSSMVICAWGSNPSAPARADVVLHDITQWGYASNLFHVGLNKDGTPKDLKQVRGRAQGDKVATVKGRARQAATVGKYGNRKVTFDGMTFDSSKEYQRYRQLCLLERVGVISDLSRQVSFELIPAQKAQGGRTERRVDYVADFVYFEGGKRVVEDSKGVKTRDYIIKRKLMLERHGITVRET